jgi:hypothetical protein
MEDFVPKHMPVHSFEMRKKEKTNRHGCPQYPHLQKLVASHLLPSAAAVGSYSNPRVSVDRKVESNEKFDLRQTD